MLNKKQWVHFLSNKNKMDEYQRKNYSFGCCIREIPTIVVCENLNATAILILQEFEDMYPLYESRGIEIVLNS